MLPFACQLFLLKPYNGMKHRLFFFFETEQNHYSKQATNTSQPTLKHLYFDTLRHRQIKWTK